MSAPERRGVLKGLVAAAAGLFGFSGTGTAAGTPAWEAEAVKIATEYSSEKAIREAISEHGSELVRALANDGFIDHASVSALPLPIHRTPKSYARSDHGVGVFTTGGRNGPKVKLQVKQRISDGRRLVLTVVPDTGESSATLHDDVTGETTLLAVDSSPGRPGISPQVCCYEWSRNYCGITCSPDTNCSCVEYRVCQQDADENPCNCEILGYSCTGCSEPGDCG